MRRQDVKKKGKWICCTFILASFPMSIRAKGLLGLVEPGVSSPRGHITQSARPSGFGVESLALFVCVCVGGGCLVSFAQSPALFSVGMVPGLFSVSVVRRKT